MDVIAENLTPHLSTNHQTEFDHDIGCMLQLNKRKHFMTLFDAASATSRISPCTVQVNFYAAIKTQKLCVFIEV